MYEFVQIRCGIVKKINHIFCCNFFSCTKICYIWHVITVVFSWWKYEWNCCRHMPTFWRRTSTAWRRKKRQRRRQRRKQKPYKTLNVDVFGCIVTDVGRVFMLLSSWLWNCANLCGVKRCTSCIYFVLFLAEMSTDEHFVKLRWFLGVLLYVL